jgi:hypothetical protein
VQDEGVESLLSCIDMSLSRVINPHPALGTDMNFCDHMQVIDDLGAIIMRDGEPLEASITEGMSHPNIVNTIAHTVTENTQKRCANL